jgi:putative aminopeptidase FrvX
MEKKVRDIIKAELSGCVDEIRVDRIGNLVTKKGSGKPKVMLTAHMDEVGFMVKSITKNGFLKFAMIGGFDERILPSQQVIVYTKTRSIVGLIGSKPPHLLKEEEKKKVVEHLDMYIDIGAKNAEEAEALGVKVGDPVIFDRKLSFLGNGNVVAGKALDDRAGCLALIEIMKRVHSDFTVYGVFTTQEEVGLKGARTSAYEVEPDVGIGLDVTTAVDTPDVKSEDTGIGIGSGPVINIVEASGRGLITSNRVFKWLTKAAEDAGIPYQIEVGEKGMSDAAVIYISKIGVPSGAISIPARYIHGPSAVIDLRDVEKCVKLVLGALGQINTLKLS